MTTATKFARYEKTLTGLSRKNRHRTLTKINGINFTSNDYLALTASPRIQNATALALATGISVGAGGSRLLRGNHEVFEKLETNAAHFFNSDKALYFCSGYTANMAILATLPQRNDLILFDERAHASLLDGIDQSRAEKIMVRHNDCEQFADKIQQWRNAGGKGHPWIIVESIYSMDGDRAPLTTLLDIANKYDGFLLIDEAHATGVFGAHGEGLATFAAKQPNVITVHTCGKAMGVAGALACMNETLYHYLINCARAFIFSTAPSPLLAIGVNEALTIFAEDPKAREELTLLYQFANQQVKLLGIPQSDSQIIPVVVGNNHRALCIAKCMQQNGFDIRAIRPPTVPEGTARLRISITLHVQKEDIKQMIAALSTALEQVP